MVRAVIFDWAGTTVDYGCHAPAAVLQTIFSEQGIALLPEEARHAMGVPKLDQIRAICELPRVRSAWQALHGEEPNEPNVRKLFDRFVPAQLASIEQYSDVIRCVPDVMENLRARGIRIGSTTGYTREMLNIILPKAARHGYSPDSTVTPSETGGAGRPAPWMIFESLRQLNVYPPSASVKVGDTPADIEEGVNAGAWSVGVASSSSEAVIFGLDGARARLREAGAHYVIDSLEELDEVIAEINTRRGSRDVGHRNSMNG